MRIGGINDLFPVKRKSAKRICVEALLVAVAMLLMYWGSDYNWRYPAVIGPIALAFMVVDWVRSRRSGDGGTPEGGASVQIKAWHVYCIIGGALLAGLVIGFSVGWGPGIGAAGGGALGGAVGSVLLEWQFARRRSGDSP